MVVFYDPWFIYLLKVEPAPVVTLGYAPDSLANISVRTGIKSGGVTLLGLLSSLSSPRPNQASVSVEAGSV